jgi:hypothetical protein
LPEICQKTTRRSRQNTRGGAWFGWASKGLLGGADHDRQSRLEALLHLAISRRAEAVITGSVQIARASSANATVSRRFAGSSTANS